MLSLRKKTYRIILFATGIFLLCVCGVIWQTTDSSLKVFQYESAEEQLALVERVLGREIENLSRTQADWAHWDDTYVFMSDRNEAYIDSNLNDESLAMIGVHIMAFVDNAGDVVFAKQVYGGAPETHSPPAQFMKHFQGESELLHFDDSISVKHGILTLPDSMFLVSSQPILMSDGKGPRRGTLVFARYIDQQYTDMLSTLAGISVRIAPYGFAGSSDSESLAVASQSDSRTMIEYVSGQTIGWRLLENVFGNPSVSLRIEYPSNILIRGHHFLLKGFAYLFVAMVSYVGILIVLIDYFLLQRIEHMRRIARQVSVLQSGGLPEGDIDDFSYLATVMMEAIKKIQESNDLAIGSRNELEKFQIALDQSFDHMIITDPEGKILYANVAAEQLTGYSQKEIIGETPGLWGRQMSGEFYRQFWDTIRLHKQVFEGEIVNKGKSGARYRALIRVAPILDNHRRVLYFIGVERYIGKA